MASAVEEYPPADKFMDKLTSAVKMDRDSGLAMLTRLVKGVNCDEGERKHLIKLLRSQIASNFTELGNKECVMNGHFSDKKLGCLSASLILITGISDVEQEQIHQFVIQIKPDILNIMWDQDVRVRLTAGEVYGQICKILGPSVYLESKSAILEMLETEFQRNKEIEGMIKSPETPIDPTGEIASSEPHSSSSSSSPQLGMSPVTTPSNPNIMLCDVLKEATHIFQSASSPGAPAPIDVAMNLGCAQLESTLKCLQFIAKGLGTQFGPLIDMHLLELIFPSLHHQNRFIREAGFYLCATMIESGIDLKSFGKRLAKEITSGLEDFCSQSRIAAGVACRKFMMNLPQDCTEFLPIVLPRLCLCRYYMADTKFLLYSQESWKLIFAMDGPQLVGKYIDDMVRYYVEATASDNHAVREAACLCLGEIARKIDGKIVAPYVVGLMETLKRTFLDERWHVRDAACLASGSFFVNFPSQCQGLLESVFPLFFENLQFPISIVRQGAAAALANIIRAYGTAVLPMIMEKIIAGLDGIENQSSETSVNVDLQVFNPQLKYAYSPCHEANPPQPWEVGDGFMYLIGDISQISECQIYLPTLVPLVLKAAQHRSYSQHVVILETTCKIIPCIVNGIGKRPFKEYLQQCFEPIFYSIECENSMTAAAGRACLKELCTIYGPNIIRSRVELYDPRFVNYVNEG
ncbi:uncharacterized protein LOC110845996 isoform X1 [Folsomia candida]|uniref:uncharacterized protein LOC110845996 isoform X1 n=1 Tax=Folsomia candida TaxID=158441 RepID=UPI000B8F4E10|nr:uncharacterized protein LOC110845996 isoform X1 [Folsomia candida]